MKNHSPICVGLLRLKLILNLFIELLKLINFMYD